MSDRAESLLDMERLLSVALAGAITPANMSAAQRTNLRDRVLQHARAGATSGLRTVRAGDDGWVATSPLTDVRWLQTEDSSTHRTFMARFKPGGEFPAHHHPFEEETYVLEGQIECGDEMLRTGDYQFAAPGSFHETIRSRDGALLLIRFQTRAGA
jgi:quercetin dioxygenase-like cupin family protein